MLEENKNIEALLEKYFFNFFEKYIIILISDQISCWRDVGHAGGIEAGGRQPRGGLGQVGQGALRQPSSSGKFPQSYNIILNSVPIFDMTASREDICPRYKNVFSSGSFCTENSIPCRCCIVAKPIFLSNDNNFGCWNDLINFLRCLVQFVVRTISLTGQLRECLEFSHSHCPPSQEVEGRHPLESPG